jgi:hypothetical protein
MKKMTPPNLPAAGARVGSVCGPGEFPCDNAGTVICLVESKFGVFAVVMMDSGRVDFCHSLNSGHGIGWHAIKRHEVGQHNF